MRPPAPGIARASFASTSSNAGGRSAAASFLCSLVGDGLQQVIHHLAVESLHRVLVEGGDEHDVGARIDALRQLQPGEPGHADVEEGDVRLVLVDGAQGVDAIAGEGQHLQLRP
jgi:hypothetical protein